MLDYMLVLKQLCTQIDTLINSDENYSPIQLESMLVIAFHDGDNSQAIDEAKAHRISPLIRL